MMAVVLKIMRMLLLLLLMEMIERRRRERRHQIDLINCHDFICYLCSIDSQVYTSHRVTFLVGRLIYLMSHQAFPQVLKTHCPKLNSLSCCPSAIITLYLHFMSC